MYKETFIYPSMDVYKLLPCLELFNFENYSQKMDSDETQR